MRKKLINTRVFLILLLSGLIISVMVNPLQAQNYYEDVICVPTSKPPYYLVNPYYYPYYISSGTVIDRTSQKGGKTERKNVVASDSTRNKLEVRQETTRYYCKVELKDYNQPIQIAAYNLLGKKVKDIYRGNAKKDGEYDIDVTALPDGLYICVVQGANLRLTEKFIVSR